MVNASVIMPDISVKVVSDHLRIYINGLLHISVDISELVGIQSWKFGIYRFSIEYIFKTTSIETWYTEREIWEAILRGFEPIGLI